MPAHVRAILDSVIKGRKMPQEQKDKISVATKGRVIKKESYEFIYE